MPKREIKNSLPKAVALRYHHPRDRAPKVTAKGSGLVAQKMIELGKQYGIPIQEDPALIQVLAQLDFYQEIPPKIYVGGGRNPGVCLQAEFTCTPDDPAGSK